jgi:hypothetical protein
LLVDNEHLIWGWHFRQFSHTFPTVIEHYL